MTNLQSVVPSDFISGLVLSWISTTQIQVSAGECFVPGIPGVLEFTGATTVTPAGLGASAWYYVYAYSNSGTPAIEVSTTAPDVPYRGQAKAKTGDTTRRYLGAIKTNASSQIMNFFDNPASGLRLWLEAMNVAPMLLVNGGGATTATNVDASGVVPPSARTLYALTQAITQAAYLKDGDATMALSALSYTNAVVAGAMFSAFIELTSARVFQYVVTSGGAFYCYARGYVEER